MESYLINEIDFDDLGICFSKGKREEKTLLWSFFYRENVIFEFKEDFLGLLDSDTEIYFPPFIIPFYWVDITAPNSAKYKDFHIRIQFPKGEEQRDEFKNVVAYHILKQLNLLNSLDSKEANTLILKMFK